MEKNKLSRRSFLSKTALTGLASSFMLSSYGSDTRRGRRRAEKSAAPLSESVLRNKKILAVWGGWPGHEPEECINRFVPWLQEHGASVVVSNSLDPYADEDLMAQTDLVLQSVSDGEISKDQEQGLLRAIQNGTALAGWHGGLVDAFRKSLRYQYAVGGQFVSHPGNIMRYKVNITDKEDPLMTGLKDFRINSEQYYMHVDPNVKVLATTTFSGKHDNWVDGCIMPVVWKKTYGKGRIFFSALGHVEKDFDVYEVTEIMKRGILWAVQSKYEDKEDWVSPVYA